MIVITVARKPIDGSLVDNLAQWGTGGLNIDESRLESKPKLTGIVDKYVSGNDIFGGDHRNTRHREYDERQKTDCKGRWPANVILEHLPQCNQECWDGCPIHCLDGQSGMSKSTERTIQFTRHNPGWDTGGIFKQGRKCESHSFGDSGGASRFFKQVQVEPQCFRASGECICETCGETFYKHPADRRFRFLNVLCNGERVKL